MTTTTAEAVTTADTTPAAPSLADPYVLTPGGGLAPEGTVIGAMPFELEINVSVAGMPAMTLGTATGKIGRLVVGPMPGAEDDGGAYREVIAYGPTLAEMARAAAALISDEILPGLAELAEEDDAARKADAEAAAAAEAADGQGHGEGFRCCKDKSAERAAAVTEGLTIKCADGSGAVASSAPVSDTPNGSAGE